MDALAYGRTQRPWNAMLQGRNDALQSANPIYCRYKRMQGAYVKRIWSYRGMSSKHFSACSSSTSCTPVNQFGGIHDLTLQVFARKYGHSRNGTAVASANEADNLTACIEETDSWLGKSINRKRSKSTTWDRRLAKLKNKSGKCLWTLRILN